MVWGSFDQDLFNKIMKKKQNLKGLLVPTFSS